MKYALIPVDGAAPVQILEQDLDLPKMREHVGGYIERVSHSGKSLDLWFNEEGKLDDLLPNERATMIAHHGRSIYPQDYIAGPCIVTGPADDEGDSLPITEEQADWLLGLDRTYRQITGKTTPTTTTGTH